MNFKISCIKKACEFNHVDFEELMEYLEIPKSSYSHYNKIDSNTDYISLSPSIKKRLSNKLNTIIPYFYGLIDDEHLFNHNITLSKYNEAKKLLQIEDYLVSIGMENYIHNVFEPSNKNYLSECHFNSIISKIYTNSSFIGLTDLPHNEELQSHFMKTHPTHIRHLPNASEKVSESAVSSFGYALEYVDKQTEEIAYRAVSNDAMSLKFVNKELHTPKVIKAALHENPLSFKYSQLKTYDICLNAVEANGINLEFVPEEYKDFKMITTALKSNGWAIMFVENQTEEYALTAVLQNTESSLYVHENIRNNNLCIKSIYDEIIKRHEFLS